VLGSGSWSIDGRWLLHLIDGAVIATAPGENYQHVLPYPFTDCTMASWIDSPSSNVAGRPAAEADETSKLNK
jgi:hypothetical protein